ncbi:MAG: efflux RND transporter periplasmic adaptor subunit [Pirellulaceae bacterium]
MVTKYVNSSSSEGSAEHDHGHGHDHGDHDHDDDPFELFRQQGGLKPTHDHDEETAIELSSSGLKNIGFEPLKVSVGRFERTISLPAMVVERPGRSQLQITAPLSGVISEIRIIEGQAVPEATSLFQIRLTHEDLVAAQRDFLRTAESLAVVDREIARLTQVGEDVIAGRRILEQKYERQKLQASLLAERQALVLHGLTESQIDDIVREHRLLQFVGVASPAHDPEHHSCSDDHLYHVQKLNVHPGQYVDAGELLCVLGDHCELYIEGRAFEDDAAQLRQVAASGHRLSAKLATASGESISNLELLYLSDRIDPDSRAFLFYVTLPNEVALDRMGPDGNRFVSWKYNPGQRLELQVPVETWQDRIVLPVEAVVRDNAEFYVYQQEGNHFHQVAVHVEYKDARAVVVSNDGTIKPGDVIAGKGAYQMHLALKNKSGAIDPHAGHVH